MVESEKGYVCEFSGRGQMRRMNAGLNMELYVHYWAVTAIQSASNACITRHFFIGLVVMISVCLNFSLPNDTYSRLITLQACQQQCIKRGRPGFDSQMESLVDNIFLAISCCI